MFKYLPGHVGEEINSKILLNWNKLFLRKQINVHVQLYKPVSMGVGGGGGGGAYLLCHYLETGAWQSLTALKAVTSVRDQAPAKVSVCGSDMTVCDVSEDVSEGFRYS